MSYVPLTWVAGTSKLGPTNLNHLETGLQSAAAVADSASVLAAAALPTPAGSDSQFLQRVSGAWVPHTLVAADMPSGIALSKLADPGVGNVVTSAGAGAIAAKPPGYEYAYAEYTSSVTLAGTTEGGATSVIAAASVTFDGSTAVWLEFWCPFVSLGTATVWNLAFFDGSTSLGGLVGVAVSVTPGFSLRRRLTPSAAAKTYSVKGWSTNGTSTAGAGAGGAGVNIPGFIRIVKA